MPITELLVDQLQSLLDAETQLTNALPKMVAAAHHFKLKEAFQKHLAQTETHVERLREVLGLLNGNSQVEPKPCRAMTGLVSAGEETVEQFSSKDQISADLALIAAAQRVEHYEIAAYGTARVLAQQLGNREVYKLLSHTLGEEESADFLLTSISDPLLQQLALDDAGADVNLDGPGVMSETRGEHKRRQVRVSSARDAA